ncbi:DUF6912 family protein [Mobiluncus porci]|uniref:Uncharacterized protein n=1 Tax=Mobiluncus porci TaxID=2652278 RepID=A0A7K0K324_9ACTO|nr:hypothetical protein [Mobiluncus porci]MST49896.1 hypothetical protein [Mobiluncus porci]
MSTHNVKRLYISLTPEALNEAALNSEFALIVDKNFLSSRGFSPEEEPRGEELEILEDEALYRAAADSLERQNGSEIPRRVVAVAELGEGFEALPEGEAGQYRLTRPLQFSEVVSYHVDEPEAASYLVEYLQARGDLDLPAPNESPELLSPGDASKSLSAEVSPEVSHEGTAPLAPPDLSAYSELPDLLWFDGTELDLVRQFLAGRP